MMESEALTPDEEALLAEAHRRGLVKTIKPDTRRLTEGEMAATLAALDAFRRDYPGARGYLTVDHKAVVDLGTLIECATIARQTLADGTAP